MTGLFLAIEPNISRPGAVAVTRDICAQLNKLNVSFAFAERNRSVCDGLGGSFLPDEELYASCNIVIAVGGDGSIIHYAKNAAQHRLPVLGINAGNVAFMAGLEADELSLLGALLAGNYFIDARMMLQADIIKDGEVLFSDCCLNDAVFARGAEINLAEIDVACDGIPVKHYRSDGIILATPTGSTAYSFAAGGPVVEPTLESMILTPISPYSMSSRSIIFSSSCVLQVSSANRERPLFLSADGGSAVKIPDGGIALVRKCGYYANFIRIKKDRFWHVLDNKMGK